MGKRRRAIPARRVDAQRGLSFSYICVANKGKPAPKADRTTVDEARAEAATMRYASMM